MGPPVPVYAVQGCKNSGKSTFALKVTVKVCIVKMQGFTPLIDNFGRLKQGLGGGGLGG